MRRPPLVAIALLLVAALLAACGGAADEPDGAAPPPDEENGGADGEDGSDVLLGEEIQSAVRDAAESEGVEQEDIEVATVDLVTWPDSALGCPQPDEMYTQALVEGYRIVLEVDGREIHYHGALGEDPFRCDDPQEPAAVSS